MSDVTRVTDILPREIFQDKVDDTKYHTALKDFVLIAAPIGLGVAVLIPLGLYLFTIMAFLGAALAILGLIFAGIWVIVFESYWSRKTGLDNKRDKYYNIINQVLLMVDNITINNQTVNVKGNAVLGNVDTINNVVDPINETYALAVKAMKIGIEAWVQNKGARPKVKPISAEALTEQLNIGREKWMEVMDFTEQAKVFHRPRGPSWKPMCPTVQDGERTMDAYMIGQGYVKVTKMGKVEWKKGSY